MVVMIVMVVVMMMVMVVAVFGGAKNFDHAQAHMPKGEGSTWTLGCMIDEFLTPPHEQCPVEQCSMLRGTPTKPDYQAQISVDKRSHLTKVLEPVGPKNCLKLSQCTPSPHGKVHKQDYLNWGGNSFGSAP